MKRTLNLKCTWFIWTQWLIYWWWDTLCIKIRRTSFILFLSGYYFLAFIFLIDRSCRFSTINCFFCLFSIWIRRIILFFLNNWNLFNLWFFNELFLFYLTFIILRWFVFNILIYYLLLFIDIDILNFFLNWFDLFLLFSIWSPTIITFIFIKSMSIFTL